MPMVLFSRAASDWFGTPCFDLTCINGAGNVLVIVEQATRATCIIPPTLVCSVHEGIRRYPAWADGVLHCHWLKLLVIVVVECVADSIHEKLWQPTGGTRTRLSKNAHGVVVVVYYYYY